MYTIYNDYINRLLPVAYFSFLLFFPYKVYFYFIYFCRFCCIFPSAKHSPSTFFYLLTPHCVFTLRKKYLKFLILIVLHSGFNVYVLQGLKWMKESSIHPDYGQEKFMKSIKTCCNNLVPVDTVCFHPFYVTKKYPENFIFISFAIIKAEYV